MFIFMHHAEMVTRPMRKELINGIFMERSPKISDNALPTKMSAFFKDKFSYFQNFIPKLRYLIFHYTFSHQVVSEIDNMDNFQSLYTAKSTLSIFKHFKLTSIHQSVVTFNKGNKV